MADLDLDPEVLESYIKEFYGHGSYEAKYWFIGMEFGGGGSFEEIVSRIEGWHRRGGKGLEDLGPQGVGTGSRWFLPPYPLQPTWAKLVRIMMSAEGQPTESGSLRAYQKDRLGREGGLDCIVELLPLPSPGLGHWKFYPAIAERHPQLAYLKDRATYTSHVAPMRIAHLQTRIEQHQPRAVVFYGSGYRHWWRQIAGEQFEPSSLNKVQVARKGHTLFVVMQHPTAHGVTKDYFDAVGRLIADARLP
ncbi:MAG: hypothetical protein M3437_09535 [Chloroflexota bacterium]|nr:hypothetical protein [Chloroflexota bacterium]MDQ5867212.1 hypothetical protein [Chloroflexota bacterium]